MMTNLIKTAPPIERELTVDRPRRPTGRRHFDDVALVVGKAPLHTCTYRPRSGLR
jgi:hypothetical protein